jgi:homoserine kinase type II
MPVLAQGAAMRFLLTRLYDWINTPADALVTPKNPLDYLKRLRFHLATQTVGGYGL